jgi:hypothetical protein
MTQKSKKKCFCLQTKSCQELKLLEYLKQLEVETYTPNKINGYHGSQNK